jgi:hypothetical protein
VLTNLALCLSRMGNLEQAEALLSISKGVKDKLGLDSSTIISNLGSLLLERGALKQAEECYRQGMAALEKSQGTLNARYATLLNNLAYLYL